MAWQLKKIPKILHVYWGGGPLSYLRFLTVKSFMKYNPVWEIRYYYPTHPTMEMSWWSEEQKTIVPVTDYTPQLLELPITKIAVDFEEIGFKNTMPEVHKSDVLRLLLLSTVGGVWSDMDILYFKPMDLLYFNKRKNSKIETIYCNRLYGHSIGFLLSSNNNKIFAHLLDWSKKSYNPLYYQTVGVQLYNNFYRHPGTIEAKTPAINMSINVVYAHQAAQTEELFGNEPKFTDESIGIHWYGGDAVWKDFLTKTDGGSKNLPDCIISDLIKQI